MHCSKKLYELDSIKLSGEISKLPLCLSDSCCSSSVGFLLLSQGRWCPEAVSVLIFVILLAEEQWFSLGSAFLIIDTLWYGEGLESALSDSSALAREQHLGVSLTTSITMSSDFTTNRFDRESSTMLVQGGSPRSKEPQNVCLSLLNATQGNVLQKSLDTIRFYFFSTHQ